VSRIANGINLRTKFETEVTPSVTQDCSPRSAALSNGKMANGIAIKAKLRGNKKATVLRRNEKFGSGERTRSQKVLSDPSRLERDFQREVTIVTSGKPFVKENGSRVY
jgi:hypothetical protein